MKQMYKIENWGIIEHDPDPYKAPELRTFCLIGERIGTGDPYMRKSIKTSRIIGKFGPLIETRNSLYELDSVDPEYEKLYPNSKQRLFDSLIETSGRKHWYENEHN